MKTFISRALLLACFCLSLPLSGRAAAPEPRAIEVNKIAAVVNGEIITLHEVRRIVGGRLAQQGIAPNSPGAAARIDSMVRDVIQNITDEILLRQEAERLEIQVSDSEVENELRKIVQQGQTSMEEFQAKIASQGGTMEDVRKHIRNNILSQRIISIMIARKVMVSQEEINAYYEAHKNEFIADRSVDISLIVFGPAANAEDVAAKIRRGELSFEEAAKTYSIAPGPENGRLGFIPWNDLNDALRTEISMLRDEQASDIFLLDMNKAMLYLHSSTHGRPMTLEEATPEIERILRTPLLETRFDEYTQQLRARAVIDIRI